MILSNTTSPQKAYCAYYQAEARKRTLWFVSGCLKACDNWMFHRTVDGTSTTLEFFIAPAFEQDFIQLMELLKQRGDIISFGKKENRLRESAD